MDKDEILERSRKEHKDRDFVEAEALSNVSAIAFFVVYLRKVLEVF